MEYSESISGKEVYAGGATSVNIRNNVTTEGDIIGSVPAGGLMGTATGNLFPDLNHEPYRWIEITSGAGVGYVREDVAVIGKPGSSDKTAPSLAQYLKTEFDTNSGGLPAWAIAAIAVAVVLAGISIYLLLKKRKRKR
jgi:hypothetical protein